MGLLNRLLIVVIILAMTIAAIIVGMEIFQQSGTACSYTGGAKIYIKKEPNCTINFMCTTDKVPFSDNCGCGCMEKARNLADMPGYKEANGIALAAINSTYPDAQDLVLGKVEQSKGIWVFGYSFTANGQAMQMTIQVENGMITNTSIRS